MFIYLFQDLIGDLFHEDLSVDVILLQLIRHEGNDS